MQQNIYSVSQLNACVRNSLEGQFGAIWLTGEISNFTQPVSGHWYLTLKDENAQVRCAMWRMKTNNVTFRPQNGMQVLVQAAVSLYEPRGDYQLILQSMHPAGEGLLQQQFEQLKMRLAAEGLFAQNLKKKLPHFCKTVGIVTSSTGAALQDILQILNRRDPNLKVVIYPSQVQGKEAATEIAQMIQLANQRKEVDALIVGRGGGSLEDLCCFNEEIVARAIFNSTLPIISAVGHETDVTIADFVADVRAPTPSAAAELISRNQEELLQQLIHKQQRLEIALDRLFVQQSQTLQHLLIRLQNQHPKAQLTLQKQRNTQLTQRLNMAILRNLDKTQQKMTALDERLNKNPLSYLIQQQQHHIQRLYSRLEIELNKQFRDKQYQLATCCTKLDGLSPLKVLARGYSIAQDEQGKAIISHKQVKIGQPIQIQLLDGKILSRVEHLN